MAYYVVDVIRDVIPTLRHNMTHSVAQALEEKTAKPVSKGKAQIIEVLVLEVQS